MNRTCTECDRWDPVDGKCAKDGELYHGWEDACDDFVEETDTDNRWAISHEDGYERRVLWVDDSEATSILDAMQRLIEPGWDSYGPNMAMYNIHWNAGAGRFEATDGKHLLVWTNPPQKLVERLDGCPSWRYQEDIGLISCQDLADYHYPDTEKVVRQAEANEFNGILFSNSVFPAPFRHTWIILQAARQFKKCLGPRLTSRIEPIAGWFNECASGPKESDPVVFRNKERGILYIINPFVSGE